MFFRSLYAISMIVASIAALLCRGHGPDLTVAKAFPNMSGPGAYFDYVGDTLRVHISNRGDVATGAVVKVDFGAWGADTLIIPLIAPNETKVVPALVPDEAWDPILNFIITVDPDNAVKEQNEGNNSATGGFTNKDVVSQY